MILGQPQAAGSAASTLMSQAMLSMMDAMGNLALDYKRNQGWSNDWSAPYYSWQGMNTLPWNIYTMPGTGMPGQQQIQGAMTQAPNLLQQGQQTAQGLAQQAPGVASDIPQQIITPPGSPMDGIWQGQGGELVLVMYGHFRIYANAENYRDGRYEVRENHLVLFDPESGTSKAFEYALNEGRLVLRSQEGRLLLFRQLPIPLPPYTLFSGQLPASTQQQTATDQE